MFKKPKLLTASPSSCSPAQATPNSPVPAPAKRTPIGKIADIARNRMI